MATIEIRICNLTQLFAALDPAPFQERVLDRSAESYILACAGRHRPTEPLRLLVHFPESLRAHAADATDAIHEHFRRAHAQSERNFRRRMRIGGFALVAAMLERLASIPIEFVFQPDRGPASMTGFAG